MTTDLLGPARIDGDRSQRVFDTLLRTLAEPGTVRSLPGELDPRVPAPLWLPLALADVDVGVHVDDPDWQALVRAATGAPTRPLEQAPFVVLRAPTVEMVTRVAVGTALAPEDGARLALTVDGLGDRPSDTPDPSSTTWRFEGPGIRVHRDVVVRGLDPAIVERLGRGSGPAPTGFDTWLFDPRGAVMSVPRTTRITEVR